MYLGSDRDGNLDSKVGKKGVLLSRRDNSQFIRNIYEAVIKKIFGYENKEKVLEFILEELNKLFGNVTIPKDFVITKSIGSVNNLEVEKVKNLKNVDKAKCGDYTLPLLSDDKEEKMKQLAKKDAINDEDFYKKSLPAQVQLALKMESRGQIVQSGTRLEYVLLESEYYNDKACEKVESYDYFVQHRDILKIDFLYYMKLLVNPMDELLNIGYKEKDFIIKQYKIRLQKFKMLNELKRLFNPKIIFLDDIKSVVV